MVFVENESLFRLSLFLGVLLSMAVWEMVSPMRELNATKLLRWLRADVGVQRYVIIPLAALVELVVITIWN